jgi:uncharacterized membrane protein
MTVAHKSLIALIIVMAVFGAGFIAGAWVRESIAIRAQQASMAGAAEVISKIEQKTTTINQKIIERIRTEKVYEECRHSPDAFKTLLEAYQ